MRKLMVFIAATLFTSVVFLAFINSYSPNQSNYISIPEYTNSHTKAICNSYNFCQDYEIFCNNQDVISMSPITGAAVQFPEDWEDPRDIRLKNEFC